MRPLVTLLLAVASLLFITGIVIASENRSDRPLPDDAIAIWDADAPQADTSSAEAAPRYARLDTHVLREAIAVQQPDDTSLPLAITTFSSTE